MSFGHTRRLYTEAGSVVAAAAQKKVVRDAMLTGPITHLSEVGRVAARERHELGTTFRFRPTAPSFLAFRTAAGSMAGEERHTVRY